MSDLGIGTQDLDLQVETTCSPRGLDKSAVRSPLLVRHSGAAGGLYDLTSIDYGS